MSNIVEDTPDLTQEEQAQQNDAVKRIGAEAVRIISWDNPVRSGVLLLLSAGSIILSKSHSLIQILSGFCTLAITINLIYVGFIKLSQKVISDAPTSNPYQSRLELKAQEKLVSGDTIVHYTSILADVAETIIRALARIILIEDAATSIKWLVIFYSIWKISSCVSSASLLMVFVISIFVFPRLYMSNRDLVDARLQQGQTLLCIHLRNAQSTAISRFEGLKGAAQSHMNKSKAE